MNAIQAAMDRDFGVIAELIRLHAQRGTRAHPRCVDGERALDYGALDALMDRIAAALQRDGLQPGRDAIAICAASSVELRRGVPRRLARRRRGRAAGARLHARQPRRG